MGPSGVALDQRVGEPELHSECDQLLLRAVVDVAFELAPLLILGRNQSLLALRSRARRSSINRAFRSTSPACAARSETSFCFGRRPWGRSPAPFAMERPPSSSPWWRTGKTSGGGAAASTGDRGVASAGNVAAGRRSSPIFSQTSARAAPDALRQASRAIRGRTSSAANESRRGCSPNSARTSYGVARFP